MTRMMLISRCLAALLTIALGSCGTYGGLIQVQAKPLTDFTYRIESRGSAFDTAEGTIDASLLKAAEVTLERGFTHYLIQGATDRSRSETVFIPGSSRTTSNASAYGVGNTAYATGSSRTTYNPPQAYDFDKPGVDLTFEVGYAGAEKTSPPLYCAAEIYRNIGKRILDDRYDPTLIENSPC